MTGMQYFKTEGLNSVVGGMVFTYILSKLIIVVGGNTLLRPDTLFAFMCAYYECSMVHVQK